tara:strand:+ start:12113 stop:12532 length:420 start_codon:yes stop_codon:yes gene_type:complete
MEKSAVLHINISCKPDELKIPCIGLLRHKYNETIFKDIYILNIEKIITKTTGKILNNGYIQYKITSQCRVLDLEMNTTYNLRITHMNKMGALHKNEKITVFIPIQYYNNTVPEVDSSFDVKIIGKRIEDSIVCVAKIIQ